MKLVFAAPAIKDLKGLDKALIERIESALDRMLAAPHTAELARIKTEPGKWRLRVGEWRVIMRIHHSLSTVYVLRIRHRREAYR